MQLLAEQLQQQGGDPFVTALSSRVAQIAEAREKRGGGQGREGRQRQKGKGGRKARRIPPPFSLSLSLSPSQWLEVLRERLPESQLDLLAQVTRQQQQEGEGEATVRALLLLRGSVDLEPGAHLLR